MSAYDYQTAQYPWTFYLWIFHHLESKFDGQWSLVWFGVSWVPHAFLRCPCVLQLIQEPMRGRMIMRLQYHCRSSHQWHTRVMYLFPHWMCIDLFHVSQIKIQLPYWWHLVSLNILQCLQCAWNTAQFLLLLIRLKMESLSAKLYQDRSINIW